jgi:hypothetical protein
MAIIYSYPKVVTLLNSDLLVGTRFENEDNGSARTVSFTAEALGSYVVANHANTLDQVLEAGNTSLLNAKVGIIYLYNSFSPAGLGYLSITGDKNAFNFVSVQGAIYAQIFNGGMFLKGIDTNFGTNIRTPQTLSTTSVATFQDKSGTIAYLSDIAAISNYGLASQINSSTPIVNTTANTSLLGSEIVGTLVVPENGFSVGDSFNTYMMGKISNNNNAGLTITIETISGVVLATTGLMTLAASDGGFWKLNADFVIREIGTAGVASIVTAGSFSHNKSSNNNLETYSFISPNNTTFDTTVENKLVIKAQWATASVSNTISSDVFILNKVY